MLPEAPSENWRALGSSHGILDRVPPPESGAKISPGAEEGVSQSSQSEQSLHCSSL